MAEARAVLIPHPRVVSTTTEFSAGLTAFLLILLLAAFSIYVQRPPAAVPANASLTEFSSARAMQLLGPIARKPHPVGSAEHAQMRDYLVSQLSALGINAEVQNTTSVDQRVVPYRAANVHNIVARLNGTANSKALMLVGHYDSVPMAPGASDDGSAVVAILETLRALKGEHLKNDLIVLFSDAEEVGLLGAKAFMDEHPWAKDVGLVLNFEARGNGGPATMFETSDGNGRVIKEFAKAAQYPVANSLSYEIYKLLPNDTDMTIFKNGGLAGLNFAFIQGVTRYHTAADNLEAIDERSLQHQGTYALALTRHFGNLNLAEPKSNNAVYFNLFGFNLIHYSSVWILPLMILVALMFVCVTVLGFKRHLLTLSGMALGFVAFLTAIVCSAVLVSLVWWLIRGLHPAYKAIIQGDTYNSGLYMLSFVALSVALTSALNLFFRKRTSVENLMMGALTWWLILMVLTSLLLPGGSFLFTWPLLFSLLALGLIFLGEKKEKPNSMKRVAVFSIGAIPGVIILAPIIYLVFVGLTLGMSGAVIVLVVLQLGLLIPHLSFIATSYKWMLPGVLALVSIGLIGAGSLTSGFDRNHPRPDNIFYGLDADKAKAVWASADESPDSWTQQFFSPGSSRGVLPEYIALSSRAFLQGPAPVAQLPPPRLEVLSDDTNNNVRTLRLRVTSPRQAVVVSLTADPDTRVTGSAVNGKVIKDQNGPQHPWALRYFGLPPQGIEVTLTAQPSAPINIRVVDQSYGLPAGQGISIQPRPENMMPSMLPYSDSTFVTKSYKF
jgi:hypothetical protein